MEREDRDREKNRLTDQEANKVTGLCCLEKKLDFNPVQFVPRGGKLTICLFV